MAVIPRVTVGMRVRDRSRRDGWLHDNGSRFHDDGSLSQRAADKRGRRSGCGDGCRCSDGRRCCDRRRCRDGRRSSRLRLCDGGRRCTGSGLRVLRGRRARRSRPGMGRARRVDARVELRGVCLPDGEPHVLQCGVQNREQLGSGAIGAPGGGLDDQRGGGVRRQRPNRGRPCRHAAEQMCKCRCPRHRNGENNGCDYPSDTPHAPPPTCRQHHSNGVSADGDPTLRTNSR